MSILCSPPPKPCCHGAHLLWLVLIVTAMESIFGFINVLPGAFSAYRWVAIRDGPLAQYFVVEETPIEDLDPFTANMYLAEDRVLCFSMVAKRDRNWTCHYDSGAVATTDTPSSLVGLIKQRRRWLNGAFFSLLYYLRNFHRFATEASHSVPRLAWMTVEFMYQVLQLLMNWFSAGSMFLILVIIFGVTVQEWEIGDELLYVFALLYVGRRCLFVSPALPHLTARCMLAATPS